MPFQPQPAGTDGRLAFHKGPYSAAIDAIYREVDGPRRPGGMILVQQGGSLLHCAGYGRANREFDRPWTPQTRYGVASVTKTMVADVILQLVDLGQLRFDTPMARFFPDFGPPWDGVTVEHLLTMSSGFQHDEATAEIAGAADWTNGYLFETMRRQARPAFAVGSYQLYCCGGYRLLGSIIEQLTGLDFDAALRKHLFDPLGMAASSARPRWNDIESDQASIYRSAGDRRFLRVHESGESSGDGAVVTTMEDLARFVDHLKRPDSTGQSRLQRLARVPDLRAGVPGFYGRGVFVDSLDGKPVWGHSGSTNCGYAYLPDDDLTIICLHNSYDLKAMTTLETVARIVTGRPRARTADSWTGLDGLYGNADNGLIFELLTVEGVPHVRVLGDKILEIREVEQGVYRCPYRSIPFEVRPGARDGSRRPTMRVVDIEADPIECLPLESLEPDKERLAPLVGRYMSSDLFALAEVRMTSAGLVLLLGPGASSAQRLLLSEVSAGFFHSDGTSVRFVPDAAGGFVMYISRFLARHLAFSRLKDG